MEECNTRHSVTGSEYSQKWIVLVLWLHLISKLHLFLKLHWLFEHFSYFNREMVQWFHLVQWKRPCFSAKSQEGTLNTFYQSMLQDFYFQKTLWLSSGNLMHIVCGWLHYCTITVGHFQDIYIYRALWYIYIYIYIYIWGNAWLQHLKFGYEITSHGS